MEDELSAGKTGICRHVLRSLIIDLIGALLLGVAVVVFAVSADFAPGGVNGLAVIANHLFKAPIGLATVVINVPIIICTFRKLGWKFFLYSLKTILICAVFMDYVVVFLPAFAGPRWLASILSGICAGIGYSLIFNAGSSTGGTDFIIVAVKKWKQNLSFGLICFCIDSVIIVLAVFVFQDIMAFVYGMVYTLVTSLVMDGTTKTWNLIERQSKNRQSV